MAALQVINLQFVWMFCQTFSSRWQISFPGLRYSNFT